MKKLLSFIFSFLILLGAFGGEIKVKIRTEIAELSLSAVDVTDGYTVSIPPADGFVRFNRVSFSYEASSALRVVFRYRQGLKTVSEELLLTSKGSEASMLLDGYLAGRTASQLIAVSFEPVVSGRDCLLSVSGFTCDLQTVPRGDVVYIENDRYKAGVSLKWGGGLCCFEDKADDKYGNLLNLHDTGRLVQQSYYGPTDIEGYENGIYENTVWSYNPVQGGDLYGNASKLVAIEIKADEISVVSRPLDWALDDKPTQTYYTNVYKLTDKGLTVRNTAVDFLQTEWPIRAQEMPAFYTISALGSFWFYDGDKPWTGGELRREDELGFWSGKPAFELRQGNRETWCAWTDSSGYGIGLFTPKAAALLAGRFEHDGSSDPRANSANYVAPLGFLKLSFDEPYTYYYYVTSGDVADMRDTFKDRCNAIGGDYRRVFSDKGVCDPHVHVYDGKAYMFTTHDRGPGQPIYRMDDWRIYSSEDLVNWTLEATVRPEDTFLGKCEECYATDSAERNGKYYFYFSQAQNQTGVMVSENGPAGPYKDALGKALLPPGLVDTACYDPTVFVDDDENKTPYIMFGYTVAGKKYYIARLNDDMISLAEEPRAVEIENGWANDACWITKLGDTYYLNSHEGDYAVSDDIYGPYTYRGKITRDCFTDHGTFFTYNNQLYFTYGIPENYGSGEPLDRYFRTTKIVYAHVKDNGDLTTDEFIKKEGVGRYDASWDVIKGEWYFASSDGVYKKETSDGFEMRGITDGSYLYYQNVENMPENACLKVRVSNCSTPCTVEIREDGVTGTLLGSCEVGDTGGYDSYRTFDIRLENSAGTHGICFVFRGGSGELLRFEDFCVAE